jgi:hypothetical protein
VRRIVIKGGGKVAWRGQTFLCQNLLFVTAAKAATTYIDFYVRRHCAEGFNLVAGLVVAFAPTPRD